MTDSKPKIGDKAPDFTLNDENGKTVKLSDFKGKRVILYFYPKDDTTGCTTQACGFRDAYPKIEEKNAVVLGVSPDDEKSHTKFKTKYNLPFTLLVDSDHKVAEAYAAWGEKTYAGKSYEGVYRSHFIIDEAGNLADIQLQVSPKDSIERALASITGY